MIFCGALLLRDVFVRLALLFVPIRMNREFVTQHVRFAHDQNFPPRMEISHYYLTEEVPGQVTGFQR